MEQATLERKNTASLWREGYVSEEYTQHFCSGLNPTMMAFSALLKHKAPINTSQPFTYFELGCGKGLTSNVLAAANPHGTFYANDFNAVNCQHANHLASMAKLPNITFLEKSFEELLSAELPLFDYITLHGVYSWINAENRSHILRFIEKNLKPGGMVYVSYNNATGFAAFAPLQKLLAETSEQISGPLEERQKHSFDFIDSLRKADASYLRMNPSATIQLDRFKKRDPLYIAHELFNQHWTLFYHTDVARDFTNIGLQYSALSNMAQNFLHFIIPEEMLTLCNQVTDPSMKELVADFITSRQFRADIFQRDAAILTNPEHTNEYLNTCFALIKPRSHCTLEASIPIGSITLEDKIYTPLLDGLAERPQTLASLMHTLKASPSLTEEKISTFVQAISKLVAVGYAQPCLSEYCTLQARSTTEQINSLIIRGKINDVQHLLVSPVLGSAIGITRINRLFLHAYLHGSHDLARSALNTLDKQETETHPVNIQEIPQQAETFLKNWLPLYQQLGIV